MMKQINHFNTYNKIDHLKDAIADNYSIASDIASGLHLDPTNIIQSTILSDNGNLKALKNNYITSVNKQQKPQQTAKP